MQLRQKMGISRRGGSVNVISTIEIKVEYRRGAHFDQTVGEDCFRAKDNYATQQAVGTRHPGVESHVLEPRIENDRLLVHVVSDQCGTQYRADQACRYRQSFPFGS